MAQMLLFIFIIIRPGDGAFSQEPEGCGAGRRKDGEAGSHFLALQQPG